jgi:hypothetical protein
VPFDDAIRFDANDLVAHVGVPCEGIRIAGMTDRSM